MEVDNPRSKQKGSRRRMVLHSMDKVLNSPGGTRNLIDSDQSDGELPPEKKSSLKKKMKAAGSKGKEMGDKIKVAFIFDLIAYFNDFQAYLDFELFYILFLEFFEFVFNKVSVPYNFNSTLK